MTSGIQFPPIPWLLIPAIGTPAHMICTQTTMSTPKNDNKKPHTTYSKMIQELIVKLENMLLKNEQFLNLPKKPKLDPPEYIITRSISWNDTYQDTSSSSTCQPSFKKIIYKTYLPKVNSNWNRKFSRYFLNFHFHQAVTR